MYVLAQLPWIKMLIRCVWELHTYTYTYYTCIHLYTHKQDAYNQAPWEPSFLTHKFSLFALVWLFSTYQNKSPKIIGAPGYTDIDFKPSVTHQFVLQQTKAGGNTGPLWSLSKLFRRRRCGKSWSVRLLWGSQFGLKFSHLLAYRPHLTCASLSSCLRVLSHTHYLLHWSCQRALYAHAHYPLLCLL